MQSRLEIVRIILSINSLGPRFNWNNFIWSQGMLYNMQYMYVHKMFLSRSLSRSGNVSMSD